MEAYYSYVLKATACSGVFYLAYYLYFRNVLSHRLGRLYLLTSLAFSLLLPLNSFSIGLFASEKNSSTQQTIQVENRNFSTSPALIESTVVQVNKPDYPLNLSELIQKLYWLLVCLFLVRFSLGLCIICFQYFTGNREKTGNLVIILNKKTPSSFSFFNWIFLNPEDLNDYEKKGVIMHESAHFRQFHSLDAIFIELISSFFWFNPFIWMLRKSLKITHEFLADEEVMNQGYNKQVYQTILLNQLAESKLISIASNLNYSQIKNRIIMMTNAPKNKIKNMKFIALLPLTAILFFSISCFNKKNDNVVTAVAPTKMNVLYMGVDNPITIAVSGYESSELTATIDNGTITGSNGDYIVRPDKAEIATISVICNGKEIEKKVFRVKMVPDPVATIDGLRGGLIDKSVLQEQKKLDVNLENFEFDLTWAITEFTVATIENGYSVDNKSDGKLFSQKQREQIAKCKSGQKIYIENIKAIGPDGSTRSLGSIVFTLK